MKKRRKKSKKKPEPKKVPTPTQEPPAQPIIAPEKAALKFSEASKPSWSRTTLRWAVKIGGVLVGPVLAVIVAIYTFWGPPWPTAPTFDPGFPSLGSPLDVPFNVTNKSAIFPIYDLTIFCAAEDITMGGAIHLDNVGASEIANGQTLQPLESRSYVCALKKFIRIQPEPKIEKATIGFLSTYKRWPWGGMSKSISDRFTLNATTAPPQWTRGIPLR